MLYSTVYELERCLIFPSVFIFSATFCVRVCEQREKLSDFATLLETGRKTQAHIPLVMMVYLNKGTVCLPFLSQITCLEGKGRFSFFFNGISLQVSDKTLKNHPFGDKSNIKIADLV